ncbi:hypothetical protein L1887_14884 [Cichorium endivia]|nr:hypothetical protein L1887_14884 [Cichorium endivia]
MKDNLSCLNLYVKADKACSGGGRRTEGSGQRRLTKFLNRGREEGQYLFSSHRKFRIYTYTFLYLYDYTYIYYLYI